MLYRKKEKKDKSFKSFRETLSGCLFSVIFEGLCFLSVGLSADSASVSLQRFPHHQRLQRGGGGWANISQALLRSPSTEKYAKTAGMEVKTKVWGGWRGEYSYRESRRRRRDEGSTRTDVLECQVNDRHIIEWQREINNGSMYTLFTILIYS